MLCILCPLYTPSPFSLYYALSIYAHSTPFYKPTILYYVLYTPLPTILCPSIHPCLLYYVLYTPIPTILCPSIHPCLLYYTLCIHHSHHCFLYAPYYYVYYPCYAISYPIQITLCIIVMILGGGLHIQASSCPFFMFEPFQIDNT